MTSEQLAFWTISFAGSIVAGWWLAVRPGATMREIATPVTFLIIVMAVLLCLLALTGQDLEGFAGDVRALAFGGG